MKKPKHRRRNHRITEWRPGPRDRPFPEPDLADWLQNAEDTGLTLYWSAVLVKGPSAKIKDQPLRSNPFDDAAGLARATYSSESRIFTIPSGPVNNSSRRARGLLPAHHREPRLAAGQRWLRRQPMPKAASAAVRGVPTGTAGKHKDGNAKS